jgi:hypothetical protein
VVVVEIGHLQKRKPFDASDLRENLRHRLANDLRKEALGAYRGYERDSHLFEGFPSDARTSDPHRDEARSARRNARTTSSSFASSILCIQGKPTSSRSRRSCSRSTPHRELATAAETEVKRQCELVHLTLGRVQDSKTVQTSPLGSHFRQRHDDLTYRGA